MKLFVANLKEEEIIHTFNNRYWYFDGNNTHGVHKIKLTILKKISLCIQGISDTVSIVKSQCVVIIFERETQANNKKKRTLQYRITAQRHILSKYNKFYWNNFISKPCTPVELHINVSNNLIHLRRYYSTTNKDILTYSFLVSIKRKKKLIKFVEICTLYILLHLCQS